MRKDFVRKEIGSEFWSVPTGGENNHLFPKETRWFLSGRSALMDIVADIQQHAKVRTAALPAWCCDSMVKPFVDAGIHVDLYPVFHENGKLIQKVDAASESDILLVMDYFGYSSADVAVDTPQILIRDLTHSVFSGKHTDARYCFGSLRKWAGFYSGGFAWGLPGRELPDNEAYIALRRNAMAQKEAYIHGEISNKDYLNVFGQAEEMLEQSLPANADTRDILMAEKLDISGMKRQRRRNAAQLLEAFAEIAVFPELGDDDCPLFVPILVPQGKRDDLRRFLIQNSIYCPVHWPLSEYHRPDARSIPIYRDELSLVCDQRYTEEDMSRLIETVKRFWKD